MKHFLTLILLVACGVSRGQNLVPNPSFEEYTDCPDNGGQLEYALHWTAPLVGGGVSSDYLNACGVPAWSVPTNSYGYELAHSGSAYSAILTARYNMLNPSSNNQREYLQVALLETLKANINYCIKFYVSACDSMHYVSNNIGIYFSQTEIRDTCVFPCKLNYIPQFENDTINDLSSRNGWTEVSGIYKAIGGEKYIVIGNFRDTTSTIATFVGWSSIPSFYYAAYYIDDVLLTPCDSLNNYVEKPIHELKVYPNPSDGYFFLETNGLAEQIEIYNSVGELISVEEKTGSSNRIAINIINQPDGAYLLLITMQNKNKVIFKLLKN